MTADDPGRPGRVPPAVRSDRVWTLFLMELRTLLRDRRTVVLSIVLPLAVMPIMLFASRWVEGRRDRALEARESAYVVVGPRAQEVRGLVARAREVQLEAGEREAAPLRLEELGGVSDPTAALALGSLDFFIEATSYGQAAASARPRDLSRGPPSGRGDEASSVTKSNREDADRQEDLADRFDLESVDGTSPDLLAVSIVFRSDRDTSARIADRLAARLRAVRRQDREAALTGAGFPLAPSAVMPIDAANLAAESQVAGLTLGRLVTLLLLFFLLSGGAVVAQDTLAGEKERGTLETLLTTAITRREIVSAKVLLVLVVALAITCIQVVNLLVYVGFGLIEHTHTLTAAITPGLAAGLLLYLLPMAALVAGVLVLVSGYAKSYREAQLYFMPVLLLGVVPALTAFLPEVSLRSAIVLVPIANTSVGVKELMVGRIDLLMLAVAWFVNAGAAAWAIRSAAALLSTERLIVPTTSDAPFRRGISTVRVGHVGVWFAVMWAVVLLTSANIGADFDIRGQLVINLVVVFLGGSFLFIRRFGLDPRVVLSLRRPHPAVWVAVIAGIPAGLVTGIGMFRLSQFIVPVPPQMLENFSQYAVPDDIPFWQLLPMMTILPAICEEIAFRGVLLAILRRHFSPVAAVLLVGATFGIFHFSLFRVLQTAYLGVLLAASTLLTGSIYPAMVWHAGSNGLALGIAKLGLGMGGFEPVTYLAAAAVLVSCFWIFWRTRPSALI